MLITSLNLYSILYNNCINKFQAQRQAQKSHAKKSVRKTKEKVLKNMLEQAALKTVMDTKNTMNEDEVITKTFNSLNKEVENDMFELPKLSESL